MKLRDPCRQAHSCYSFDNAEFAVILSPQPRFQVFFCGVLLACHVRCGRSPSVSEVSEKTDFPNFSSAKHSPSNNFKQFNYLRGRECQRQRTFRNLSMKGAVLKRRTRVIRCRDTCDESASAGVIDAIDVIGKTTMTTNATKSPVKQDHRRWDATAYLDF